MEKERIIHIVTPTIVRRSSREPKKNDRFSPPRGNPSGLPTSPSKRGRKPKKDETTIIDKMKEDVEEIIKTDEPLRCDHCSNNFFVDPSQFDRHGKKQAPSEPQTDPNTGEKLVLCYSCDNSLKLTKKSDRVSEDNRATLQREKEQYLAEAKSFADSLVVNLGDANAEKLFCPRFTSRPCRCIQTFLVSGGRSENYRKRAQFLLNLIKMAQSLSTLKCYDRSEVINTKKRIKVGLGNGQKRSKTFEDFVMTHRSQLKEEHNLCEMAIKKILCYSNNFLFKRLKSEKRECRVEKVKGRNKKDGILMNFEDMEKWKCCKANCSLMAVSHRTLLQEWRDRAAQGQNEMRRVIAEMLTPSGLQTNCYQFIRQVTGVTSSVIGSVNNHMKSTGGSRDPAPHGLKAYWQRNPKRRKLDDSDDDEGRGGLGLDFHRKASSTEVIPHDVHVPTFSIPQTDPVGADGVVIGDGEVMSGIVTGENGMMMELVTFISPDGTAQIIQVPVISSNSTDQENFHEEINLQLAAESSDLSVDPTHFTTVTTSDSTTTLASDSAHLTDPVHLITNLGTGAAHLSTDSTNLTTGSAFLATASPSSDPNFTSDPVEIQIDPVSKSMPAPGSTHTTIYMDRSLLDSMQVNQDSNLNHGIDIVLDKADQSSSSEKGLRMAVTGMEDNLSYNVVMGSDDTSEGYGDGAGESLVFSDGHLMDGFVLGQAYNETRTTDSFVTNIEPTEGDTNGGTSSPDVVEVLEQGNLNLASGDTGTRRESISLSPDLLSSRNNVVDLTSDSGQEEKTQDPNLITAQTAFEIDSEVPHSTDSSPDFILDESHNEENQEEQAQIVVDKGLNSEGTDLSIESDCPQKVIQRAQQLIAESQKVVQQSTELAQQAVVQPRPAGQLQQIGRHSQKAVIQQQLSAVQREQLAAAHSLQQLSAVSPGKKTKVDRQDDRVQSMFVPRMSPGMLPVRYVAPTILPADSPGSQTSVEPKMQSAGAKGQLAKQKRKKELTKLQLLPSISKKAGQAKTRASTRRRSSAKQKKSPYILPKQTQAAPVNSSSTTITMPAGFSDAAKQLLIPVVGTRVALTVGTDSNGMPQLLIPCITTDKPSTAQISSNQVLASNPSNTHIGSSYESRSNSIILQHPNTSGGGTGSFSVDHASNNVGVCFHPNSSVQGYVNIPSSLTSDNLQSPIKRSISDVQKTVAQLGMNQMSSATEHLKELLPIIT